LERIVNIKKRRKREHDAFVTKKKGNPQKIFECGKRRKKKD